MSLTRMRLWTDIIQNPYPYLFQSARYCHLDTWDYLDSFCLLYQKPSSARTASRHNSGPWQHKPCVVKKGFLFHDHSISQASVFFKSRAETTGHESNFVCLPDRRFVQHTHSTPVESLQICRSKWSFSIIDLLVVLCVHGQISPQNEQISISYLGVIYICM